MAVRMVHAKHGVTFASGAEIDWNKANGWRVEQLSEKEAAPAGSTASSGEEAAPSVDAYDLPVFVKRGPGRPRKVI